MPSASRLGGLKGGEEIVGQLLHAGVAGMQVIRMQMDGFVPAGAMVDEVNWGLWGRFTLHQALELAGKVIDHSIRTNIDVALRGDIEGDGRVVCADPINDALQLRDGGGYRSAFEKIVSTQHQHDRVRS